MIGYILTIEQKDAIQGVYYGPYVFFNCVRDINGVWYLFLSEQDKEEILNTEWNYLLTLPEGEYMPPPPPPFHQLNHEQR